MYMYGAFSLYTGTFSFSLSGLKAYFSWSYMPWTHLVVAYCPQLLFECMDFRGLIFRFGVFRNKNKSNENYPLYGIDCTYTVYYNYIYACIDWLFRFRSAYNNIAHTVLLLLHCSRARRHKASLEKCGNDHLTSEALEEVLHEFQRQAVLLQRGRGRQRVNHTYLYRVYTEEH